MSDSTNTELEQFFYAGQRRYRCPGCQFDHYDPQEVMRHYRSTHAVAAPDAPPPVLFDFEGRPLEYEQEE